MNNYTDTFQTFEHKQKYVRKHTSKKSKSYDNTERKGAASSNKEISCKQDCKQSYKAQRDAKRMNWESVCDVGISG